MRALADEPVLVIATTATDGAGIAGELPENARVAPYIPYQALLPQVTALVTNGGYGGVQMALSHGVPLVVAGGSEEKPEIRLTLRRVERALQDVVRARRGLVVDERAAAGERDRALFDATLHRVLDADLTRWPDRRLSNELAKVKAARYLGAAEQLVPLVGTGHRTGAGTGHDVSDSTRRTSTEFVVGAPPRDGP